MKRKSVRRVVFLALGLLLLAAVTAAGEKQRCLVCGMDVSQYPHSRCEVQTTDGSTFVTCGVQCALTLHLRFKGRWKSASARDLLSNRAFDVQEGHYVHAGSVITDMAPGFIAFKRKSDAERFARGFEGRVVTYPEALEIWRKRMQE